MCVSVSVVVVVIPKYPGVFIFFGFAFALIVSFGFVAKLPNTKFISGLLALVYTDRTTTREERREKE